MASIVKRKNRYSVVYTYKDDDGNQHQKWETFDTNADAKKRKTQIEFEQQSGTFIIPNATTVADLLEEYCSVYGVNNWAMSTYRSKKGLMYNYIIPLIGDVKLDELTPRLMDKFYQSLLKVKTKVVQNKKPKNEYLTVHTVREIHKFLALLLLPLLALDGCQVVIKGVGKLAVCQRKKLLPFDFLSMYV